MKTLVVLLVLVVALALADDRYTDRFDNVDLDEILNSDRLLNNYVHCLLGKGRCTPDASELKAHLAEALQNDCAKCTEKQRDGSKKVIRHIYKHRKNDFDALSAIYDKEGIYIAKYKSELEQL